MKADPDMAGLATLLMEPARAAILTHLLDGRNWTTAELAKVAGVKAPTASTHLQKLTAGNLIRVSSAGRHRYFRLADAEVGRLLEQLAFLHHPAPQPHWVPNELQRTYATAGFVTITWPGASASS